MNYLRITCSHLMAIAISLVGIYGANYSQADTLTLRADEWCPYNCTPNSDTPGYMIEIMKRIFEPAGHSLDYQTLNWARAIEETRQGKYTAIVGASKNDAPDFVFTANELGQSLNAYATLNDDPWSFTGLPSLAERTLGVIRNYAYGDELDAYIKANLANEKKIQVASGDNALEMNFRKLLKKRINTMVDGRYVLMYNISRLSFTNQIRIAGQHAAPDPIYIAFSPINPKAREYAELLSQGIDKLRTSGELKKILERYGLNDWK